MQNDAKPAIIGKAGGVFNHVPEWNRGPPPPGTCNLPAALEYYPNPLGLGSPVDHAGRADPLARSP